MRLGPHAGLTLLENSSGTHAQGRGPYSRNTPTDIASLWFFTFFFLFRLIISSTNFHIKLKPIYNIITYMYELLYFIHNIHVIQNSSARTKSRSGFTYTVHAHRDLITGFFTSYHILYIFMILCTRPHGV